MDHLFHFFVDSACFDVHFLMQKSPKNKGDPSDLLGREQKLL